MQDEKYWGWERKSSQPTSIFTPSMVCTAVISIAKLGRNWTHSTAGIHSFSEVSFDICSFPPPPTISSYLKEPVDTSGKLENLHEAKPNEDSVLNFWCIQY